MKTAISTKKKKENKTQIITLRVTEQQKQEIEQKAAEMGLGISACLSHVLADYANQKKESQQASAKMIEITIQKEIMEQALLKAQQDSQTLDVCSPLSAGKALPPPLLFPLLPDR